MNKYVVASVFCLGVGVCFSGQAHAMDTTPPDIESAVTGTKGSNNWYISNVNVAWKVSDAESSISNKSGCDTVSRTTDTSGKTYTCTATSSGGTRRKSVTIKRDATLPTMSISRPVDNATYTLNQAVNASYYCGDALSKVASCTGTVGKGAAIDTATTGAKLFSVKATDNAGNSATKIIKYTVVGVTDNTPPVVTSVVAGTTGSNGWYTSNVGINWTVADAESAISSTSGCDAVTISNDTTGTTFTCKAISAGGTTTKSVTIKRDANPPSATIVTPANGANYTQGQTLTASYSCTDATSGIKDCTGTVANSTNINLTITGAKSFSVNATDQAGNSATETANYTVASVDTNAAAIHAQISSYDGPSTCIACHEQEAHDVLTSIHMQWSGPTPELTNTNGENKGKAEGGINTYCTYAPSSKGACYGCHLRLDGNAPHPPTVEDVDCLMCHNDTYQRSFVPDDANPLSVTDYLGIVRDYVFGLQDPVTGDYQITPNFAAMPAGTTMVQLARTVHLPTRKSCLRCHAKAGGGDWTKRGDMGLNSANPTVAQDVHMSADPGGANLNCSACHAAVGHKIGGRGIDLRSTEATPPSCVDCHTVNPHNSTNAAVLNRHAEGQVACQTCHITKFAKGGSTEISRDWLSPVWNQAFCNGQGGYVGEEIRASNVTPEYRLWDGTSVVYNLGEIVQPESNGFYSMAKANGTLFDGKSQIFPIKRHESVMPRHDATGQIIAPQIMDMFMTGNFDNAVQAGMTNMGLTGSYTMVPVEAEQLITHGVDPKALSLNCNNCHDMSGHTPDGAKQLPFGQLGYKKIPAAVKACDLCHSPEDASWQSVHNIHTNGNEIGASRPISCQNCHSGEPKGLIKPTSDLCNDCHGMEVYNKQDVHKKHSLQGKDCTVCHKF